MKRLTRLIILVLFNVVAIEVLARVVVSAYLHNKEYLFYGTSRYWRFDNGTMHQPENFLSYWKFMPNESRVQQTFDGVTTTVKINNFGFRGQDFNKEKSKDIIRIATLGASSTFGYLDSDEQTYPYLLEKILNSNTDKKFEVYNFGIPHLESINTLALLRSEVLDFYPDIVTFYEGYNDASHLSSERLGNFFSAIGHVSLFVEVFRRLVVESLLERSITPEELEKEITRRKNRFIENLDLIAEECSKRNIRFILSTQQAKSHFISEDKINDFTFQEEVELVKEKMKSGAIPSAQANLLIHSELMKALREYAAQKQLPLADSLIAMDHDRAELKSHVHLSNKGNEIVAKVFADKIIELQITK